MKIKQLALCSSFLLTFVYGELAFATDKQETDKSIETPDLLLFSDEKIIKNGVVDPPVTFVQRDMFITKPDLLEVEFKEKVKSVKDVLKGKQSKVDRYKPDKKNAVSKQIKENKFSDTQLTDDPIMDIID